MRPLATFDAPPEELNRLAAGQLAFARERLATYARAESPSGDPEALAACADLIAAGHAEAGGRVQRVPGPLGDHLVTTWEPGPELAGRTGDGSGRGSDVPAAGDPSTRDSSARDPGTRDSGARDPGTRDLGARERSRHDPTGHDPTGNDPTGQGATGNDPNPHGATGQGATGQGATGAGHLLLIGHYDTVWPVGRLADMPYVDDGERIAGPGVFDMKGGLVVIEAACRVLGELGSAPARPVRLVVVADEEVGSPDGRRCIEQHLQGAVAAFGFESPHPRGVLKTGRRGSSRLRIRVTGREAHAAIDPGKGVSAIDELLDQLAAVRGVVPADGSTLLNIGRIRGGTRSNVVAGEAVAELGLRFTDLAVEREVLDRLRALTPVRDGAKVEVELLSHRPAWAAPEPNPLLALVAATGARLGQDITGRTAPGAGDTNLTGAAGVPTLDGFGPLGRGAHAAEESIVVSSLAARIALLSALLLTPEYPHP